MKSVSPAIVLGALLVASPASRSPRVDARTDAEVVAPVVREAQERFLVPLREEKQAQLHAFMPANCMIGPDFDVVLHFHGSPPVLGRALSETGMNAVVAVENLGIISKDYGPLYTVKGLFEILLRRVVRLVERGCPGPEYRPRRIALSAWSAGYAAVGSLLANPDVAPRVDAVLLSDGLHGAFIDPRLRLLPPGALGPFVAFARDAAEGKSHRFMMITHSRVDTPDYASTTEATSFLLAEVGVERVLKVPAEPKAGMLLESRGQRGGLIVEGYDGGDEAAHARQLHGIAQTHFVPLHRHWEATPAPPPLELPSEAPAPVNVTVEVKGDELCTQVGTHVECRPSP